MHQTNDRIPIAHPSPQVQDDEFSGYGMDTTLHYVTFHRLSAQNMGAGRYSLVTNTWTVLHHFNTWSQGILGCDTVQHCGRILVLQRTMQPPSYHHEGGSMVLQNNCILTLHGIRTQKTSSWIFTATKTPNLAFQ
jgi:hypothetical protein